MTRVGRQPSVGNPSDFVSGQKPFSESLSVVEVALSAEGNGFETLEEEEGTEGVLTGSDVTELFNTEFDAEGHVDAEGSLGAKDVPELHAAVISLVSQRIFPTKCHSIDTHW